MICASIGKVYCIDTLVAGMRDFLSCFVVDDEHALLSDPGPPCIADEVLNSINELGLNKIDYIALSHIHVDHAGATYILAKELDAKILVHPKAAKHLIDPERLWKSSLEALGDVASIYGKPEPIDENRIIPVEDNQIIDLGKERVKVVYTPGHAVHHVSYFLEKSKVLLSGESIAMFLKGKPILTSPIPPMGVEDVMNTFRRIEQLTPNTIAFCHFGFSSPDNLLERVREKTKKWFEIAKEVVKLGLENQDLIEEFNRRLIERDEDYRALVEYYKNDYKESLIFSYPYRTVLGGILALVRE
jgi:glyoxylase-like metal-dependent hydrolase (beta-lactamase superfamily II)